VQLEPPRFENGRALLIAGLREHYTPETMKNVPELWRRFAPHIGKVSGQVGPVAYGLCFNALSPDGMDYLAGVEVSASSSLPSEFSVAIIPVQKYAAFSHREHVSKLYETLDAIDKWLPGSGLEVSSGALRRRAFSSVTPRNSIPKPEWAVWRFGYRSNRDATEETFCNWQTKGALLQRPSLK